MCENNLFLHCNGDLDELYNKMDRRGSTISGVLWILPKNDCFIKTGLLVIKNKPYSRFSQRFSQSDPNRLK